MIIGVTGSLGSGKSTCARWLKFYLRGYIIDADRLAHRVFKNHRHISNSLVRLFGQDILNASGEIVREKVAAKAFSNDGLLYKLNSIVHPPIIRDMQRRISDIYKKDKNSFIIIDAPLLIESGFHKSCDAVVVVKSNLRLQVKRCRQKNIIPQEAMRRIKKQMPIAKKIGFADYVINNTGSLSELKKSCRESANIIRKKYI